MDNLTPDKRSKIMRAIKSKDTKEEVLLAKALWHRGNRYRKHDKTIFGTPDLSFRKYKIAVFVDGEFFHGKDWEILKKRLETNKEFWHKKIERNIQRDQNVNEVLHSLGWKVLRFWSSDVRKNLYSTVRIIESEIEEIRALLNYKGII